MHVLVIKVHIHVHCGKWIQYVLGMFDIHFTTMIQFSARASELLFVTEERVLIGEGALTGWSTFFVFDGVYLNTVRYLLHVSIKTKDTLSQEL